MSQFRVTRLARWPARSRSSGGGAVCGDRRVRAGDGGSEGRESFTVPVGIIGGLSTFVATDARPYAKWGEAAIAGWQPLPDVLLKNQHKLDLTATELLVFINLLSFWWYA